MSTLDEEITKNKHKIVLKGSGYSAPGADILCYGMFQLPEEILNLVF